jgi:hypothetical protein
LSRCEHDIIRSVDASRKSVVIRFILVLLATITSLYREIDYAVRAPITKCRIREITANTSKR